MFLATRIYIICCIAIFIHLVSLALGGSVFSKSFSGSRTGGTHLLVYVVVHLFVREVGRGGFWLC